MAEETKPTQEMVITDSSSQQVFDRVIGRKGSFTQVKFVDISLSETLFKLWMSGRTFPDLVRLYKGTPQEFTIGALQKSAEFYQWPKRKQRILSTVTKDTDEELRVHLKTKIDVLSQVIALTAEQITRDYNLYLQHPDDPAYRPDWLPRNVKEIDTLFRLHDFLLNGDPKARAQRAAELEAGVGNEIDDVSDEARTQLLRILSEDATRKVMTVSKTMTTTVSVNSELTRAETPLEKVSREEKQADSKHQDAERSSS